MGKHRWGIVFADPHVGSIWGLRRPEAAGPKGDRITAGPIGVDLWRAYKGLLAQFSSPDFLFFLGDAVEGPAAKDGSRICWTSDISLQIAEATALLNLWNAAIVFGVRGTKYHVEAEPHALNADEMVLRGVRNAAMQSGSYAPPDRYVNFGPHAVVHLSHKISGTRVFQYRGTAPSRELMMNRVMSHESEVYHAHLILRGHVHHYYEARAQRNSRCVVCPGFKARDDYAALNNPFGWMPHVGVLLVEIKDGRIARVEPQTIDLQVQRPPLEDFEGLHSATHHAAKGGKGTRRLRGHSRT